MEWIYPIISVVIVSLVSFIGVLTLSFKIEKLRKVLIYLISFSAGALFGNVFLHLLPESASGNGFNISISLSVLFGIVVFFVLEKVIHWQHCHMPIEKEHVHDFAYMNLVGDTLHNFIDGLIIAASYLVSIPVGIATTFAVVLHEIPQEIGEFGVLLHGGFSKSKALILNFLSACFAIIGALIGLWLSGISDNFVMILIPFAAGGFIYIAGSDLIPELHKETKLFRSVLQAVAFVFGIILMWLLLMIG
ncbi:MAG: ZIP family metal transporter [Nanoarchaeota archaeon]